MNINFPKNRIFHQYYGKDGYYDKSKTMDFDFFIIGEYQRLGSKYDLIGKMISSDTHKHTNFLGDNLQRLNSDSDDGI